MTDVSRDAFQRAVAWLQEQHGGTQLDEDRCASIVRVLWDRAGVRSLVSSESSCIDTMTRLELQQEAQRRARGWQEAERERARLAGEIEKWQCWYLSRIRSTALMGEEG